MFPSAGKLQNFFGVFLQFQFGVDKAGKKKKLAENYEQRVKDMDAFLSGNSGQILEFDNDLVRRLVASIKVISADRIQIQFQSGIVMEQEIGNE